MPLRYVIKRTKRLFIYRVLHVDDTPHRIALGVAVGIFIAWTPTIGFQMLLTVLLATLFRANKLVGVPFVWISNPFTLVPIYYPNYIVGRWLLSSNAAPPDFLRAFDVGGGWWFETWANRIISWWEATWHAFGPLWLGSMMVALILGTMTYFTVRHTVVAYRGHRHRVHLKHEASA